MRINFNDIDYEEILITMIIFLVTLFINAWIITVCWNDYFIHVINGLHEIDMMQAIAIRVFVSALMTSFNVERNSNE